MDTPADRSSADRPMETVVAALGGNALLRRGERPELELQRRRIAEAAPSLAAMAQTHRLVLTHGNGPQVGLLALQGSASTEVAAYTLDALDAETEGMIGYLLQQALRNAAPGLEVATLLSQVVVDRADPGFGRPTKPIGAVYPDRSAAERAGNGQWTIAADGHGFRRVVASPDPKRVVELNIIRHLVDADVVVIAVGGGGIPVVEEADGSLHGVEAVIDKDLATALLASGLGAQRMLLLTDVDAVHDDFRGPNDRAVRCGPPAALRALALPAGSMGPKVEASCRFAESGGEAVIGSLDALPSLLAGLSGTTVSLRFEELEWWAQSDVGS
ncbi:MAG TPA: carbamate kinase [Ilumatobacteraceae bacterium]|nr:carbamate kinase [Ilumatobacteraceae bacterium]